MNILIKLMSIVSLVIAPYISVVGSDNAEGMDMHGKHGMKHEMKMEMKIMKTVDSLGNEKIDTVCFMNGKEMTKAECAEMESCKKACESGEMSKEECEKKCAEKGTSCH